MPDVARGADGPLSVAVLGLGRIGAGNVALAPGVVMTHVGAILATPGLRLAAAVDPDEAARRRAQEAWGERLGAPRAAITEGDGQAVDVVTISGSTAVRERQFEDAWRLHPRVILCEKPLAASLPLAGHLVHETEKRGIALFVNFHRRFDPATRAFRAQAGDDPIAVHARYGKGLFNFGSHLVDLLLAWFGPVSGWEALDWSENEPDPTTSFRAQLPGGAPVLVQGLRGAAYEAFDIELSFRDRRLVYADGGSVRSVLTPRVGRVYSGLSFLDVDTVETGPVSGFVELYAALRDFLHGGGAFPGCTGREALNVQAILDTIQQSADNRRSANLHHPAQGDR